MSKVRVVLAEMEGSDEAVLGAIRSFVGVSQEAETPINPHKEIAAPAIDPPAPALPAPAAPAEDRAAPRPSREARGAGKQRRRPTAPAPASSPAASEDSACMTACLAALAKGPRTSVELIEATKFSSGSVYPALKRLRDAGRVVMWEDPADGQRKNKLA